VIDLIITQRRRDLGGFEVGRVLPFAHRRMVGPFIFFDHMGPASFPAGIPREVDVRPHPHIGISTVTYLFEGEIMHRDSVGSEQTIKPGAVNWMTAGRGITHSERFERARLMGDTLNGIQAWVALPLEDEETDPAFAHYGAEDLPTFEEEGAWARLIAGEAFGLKSRVKAHSPMFYLHWELKSGARGFLPADYPERALYIAGGAIELEGNRYQAGSMLVLSVGRAATFTAIGPTIVMGLGGDAVGPRFIEWNFVSSSYERIEQAKSDWRGGRMKLPDLDNQEWIPLPPDPPPPPEPMS
jgi:redox-sensitive bicupin YhaK (pirin superfamily)